MKSLFEIRPSASRSFACLAALSAGAALLSGCGGASAPVNAAEVPAATEAKPSAPVAPPTENKTAAAAAAAVSTAAPAAPPADKAAAAAPTPSSTAKPAAPPAAPAGKKKAAAKKTDANGSCGAGTCG